MQEGAWTCPGRFWLPSEVTEIELHFDRGWALLPWPQTGRDPGLLLVFHFLEGDLKQTFLILRKSGVSVFPLGCLCLRYLSKEPFSDPGSQGCTPSFSLRVVVLLFDPHEANFCVRNEATRCSFVLLHVVVPAPLAERMISAFPMALALLPEISRPQM